MSSRRLSYAALIVAMGLTGAYAETIPNFEVLTLVVFTGGLLLGVRDGGLVGAATMFLYSVLNPYGAAHPLVTLAQVAGETLTGVTGGLLGRIGLDSRAPAVRAATLGIAGAGLTAFYDFVTNLATGFLYGQMRITLIGGIPLSLWHIGTNATIFAALGTPLLGVLGHYRSRLFS